LEEVLAMKMLLKRSTNCWRLTISILAIGLCFSLMEVVIILSSRSRR